MEALLQALGALGFELKEALLWLLEALGLNLKLCYGRESDWEAYECRVNYTVNASYKQIPNYVADFIDEQQ
ncbi:hypothetical protein NDU88_000298 [Pleurodeles waltl]|uniref:Uncharacterized protein n=1 Tax=Pleurodeles waltl TaxID=8319 RepID=A0AAV7VT30_PLEWA|nr:hypothetical protein NDU88_000298 [Pleurodeles waltl]